MDESQPLPLAAFSAYSAVSAPMYTTPLAFSAGVQWRKLNLKAKLENRFIMF